MSVSPNMKIINYNAFVSCKYLTNVFLACVLPKYELWGRVCISVSFLLIHRNISYIDTPSATLHWT